MRSMRMELAGRVSTDTEVGNDGTTGLPPLLDLDLSVDPVLILEKTVAD